MDQTKVGRARSRRYIRRFIELKKIYEAQLLDKTLHPPDITALKYKIKVIASDIVEESENYFSGKDEVDEENSWEIKQTDVE